MRLAFAMYLPLLIVELEGIMKRRRRSLQDVTARTSIPASRAWRNGMKPAVLQSLSMITYRFSIVFVLRL